MLYELRYQRPFIINKHKDSAYWKVKYHLKTDTIQAKNAADARKQADKILGKRFVSLPSGKKYFCEDPLLYRMHQVQFTSRLRSSLS
jgi:hypothetical protein